MKEPSESAPELRAPTDAPRWQRRPTERRQEILQAARAVFGEEGFQRATLAQVARRAGVCAGTVSHYFGSKADLFEAMVAEHATQIAGDEALLVGHRGSVRELLHELLGREWRRMNDPGTPELILVVLGEMQSFPQSAQLLFRGLFERSHRVLVAAIEAGKRSGEFDVADPDATAHVLSSLMLGAVLDLHFVAQCTTMTGCRDSALPTIVAAADRLVGARA